MNIQDEFSDLPVSRQRKYQLRRKRDGLCVVCGKKAVSNPYCLKHAIYYRELKRRERGCVRRNNTLTYRLAKKKK